MLRRQKNTKYIVPYTANAVETGYLVTQFTLQNIHET